jgi:DUF4097 and DUF4098 domain-containing protein YvlB
VETSFRLQIKKENGNFIVPVSNDVKIDDTLLSQIKTDLSSWIKQYESEVTNDTKFLIRSGEKEITLH